MFLALIIHIIGWSVCRWILPNTNICKGSLIYKT